MKVLAIETATLSAGAALIEDGCLMGEYILNHKMNHSEKLMPMVQDLLKGLGINISEIDLFAGSTGPGSFTGIRIGISTVKALAYAGKKRVCGVNTLDGLANNITHFDGLVCPMIDARNSQVYTALYKHEDSRLIKQTEYMGIGIEQLCNLIIEKNQPAMFVGNAVDLHKEYIKDRLKGLSYFPKNSDNICKASSIGMIAYRMWEENDTIDSFTLMPFYLRKSSAEQEYEKRIENERNGNS